jgi:hypothetical protein
VKKLGRVTHEEDQGQGRSQRVALTKLRNKLIDTESIVTLDLVEQLYGMELHHFIGTGSRFGGLTDRLSHYTYRGALGGRSKEIVSVVLVVLLVLQYCAVFVSSLFPLYPSQTIYACTVLSTVYWKTNFILVCLASHPVYALYHLKENHKNPFWS